MITFISILNLIRRGDGREDIGRVMLQNPIAITVGFHPALSTGITGPNVSQNTSNGLGAAEEMETQATVADEVNITTLCKSL